MRVVSSIHIVSSSLAVDRAPIRQRPRLLLYDIGMSPSYQHDTNQNSPSLLTTEEVSAYLKVPIGTLYKWRREEKGPRSFRLGRGTRYRREDLHAWLEEQA